MKIALCTELRNVEWFESRLRSLFDGDGHAAPSPGRELSFLRLFLD